MDDHWEDFIIHTKWEMLVMFMSEKLEANQLYSTNDILSVRLWESFGG